MQHELDKQEYRFHYIHIAGYRRASIIPVKLVEYAASVEVKMVGHGQNIYIYGNNWIKILRCRAEISKLEFEMNQQSRLKQFETDSMLKTLSNKLPQTSLSIDECFGVKKDLIRETLKRNEVFEALPFQGHVWPALLSGYDTIAIGTKNCGKMLSYLLPSMLHCHQREGLSGGPSVIILAHNTCRIGAIYRELKKFAFGSVCDAVCLQSGQTETVLKETMRTIKWVDNKLLISHPKALERCAIELELMKLDEVSFVAIDEGKCPLKLDEGE